VLVREDEVGLGLGGVPDDSGGDDHLGEGFGGFSFKEFCKGSLGNIFLTLEIPESSHATKYWHFSSDKPL